MMGNIQVCYAFILRTIKRFKDDNGTIHNDQGQRHRVSSVNASGRKLQAVGRHKYIYVIGTVLIVDLLRSTTALIFKVFIGVHSVCQPLCYFRMTEFRRLACCITRIPWSNSRSCSVLNKSFATEKVPSFQQTHDL
ncbi:unnamed protein product [Strongylus vulgaris]|uniref:G-protein coupled receptors family 1 profile domain-containing protein n=1 Tax=Strongylus vulgaris TaxID=40348 RepID=A0A3P7K0E4_STRVU|nr:unnamed protein product [Strongylus vulgaris]